MRMLILCSLILLSGCTSFGEIQVVHSQPPQEVLTCSAEPEPPANDTVDAFRNWSARIYFAWKDCHEQLARVREFLDAQATQH